MLQGFGAMGDWILGVVAVCMFALFVELLAPDNELGKHVRMVLGFTIILFLIKPLVAIDLPGLLSGGITKRLNALSAMAPGTGSPDTESVVADGKRMAEDTVGAVSADQYENATEQLESALELLGGLEGVAVGLITGSDRGIEGARVTYSGEGLDDDAEDGLRRYVGAALGVDPGKIQVQRRGVLGDVKNHGNPRSDGDQANR